MRPSVLRSPRLVLSTPTAMDIDAITRCCQDAAVQRWTTVPSPYTREDAAQFVLEIVGPGWSAGTSATWGIRRIDDESLIGMIGLDGIASGAAELGFWLSPAARGNGFISDAVRLVCDFGFRGDGSGDDNDGSRGDNADGDGSGLGLLRIQWHAIVGNTASASVARRAGFRFEGTQRLGGVQRGSRVDSWSAALLTTDPREPADGWPPETRPAQARSAQARSAQARSAQARSAQTRVTTS